MISVIMPTNNRRVFARQAIKYFERYAKPTDIEMIIVDAGTRPLLAIDLQGHDRIKHIKVPPTTTTGEMLNIGIHASKGSVIARQDDDDWYSPDYLDRVIEAFTASSHGIARCGKCYNYDMFKRNAWLGEACGGTFVFRREIWEQVQFPNMRIGEDGCFLNKIKKLFGKSETLFDGTDIHVHVLHGRNITGYRSYEQNQIAVAKTREILGQDFDWYNTLDEMLSCYSVGRLGV